MVYSSKPRGEGQIYRYPLMPDPAPAFRGLSNRLDFFELLRRLERDGGLCARVGSVGERAEIDLRVIQPADLSFAPREVVSVEQERPDGRQPRLVVTCRHFGMFAPYGPLPIHMTEHARQENLSLRNRAFEEFTSLFSQRLAIWHYRAWAQMNVALGHDRPQNNAFLQRVSQISGTHQAVAANEHVQRLRTCFAGAYLPGRMGLQSLRRLLTDYFRLPVSIIPRFARWIDDGEGGIRQKMGILGRTRVGRRFFDAQHTARITLGPLPAPHYQAYQPGGERLAALLAICRDYVGQQILFDVALDIITQPEMSGRLGQARLSKDGWLKAGHGLYTQEVFQQTI
ncbi:TPA: type VI secretion system baseplate subunit TssG [Serratia odorifera]|nr:type VI secretion system baseplate subunit TssG [Serratia odorifera]